MTLVRPAPPEHWCWISSRACLAPGPGFGVMEAIEDLRGAEGPCHIRGQVAFDGWTANSVTLHIALDSPIALRGLLRQCFGMAFIQFGRGVVTAMVLSTNARSLRLCQHLGYRELFRGRDWWAPGVDMCVLEMRKAQCRFLGNPRANRGENAMREAA